MKYAEDDRKCDKAQQEDGPLDKEFEENMEEINEMLENAPANTLTLCRMGGMSAIMSLLATSTVPAVRLRVVRLFAMITRNNKKVQ